MSCGATTIKMKIFRVFPCNPCQKETRNKQSPPNLPLLGGGIVSYGAPLHVNGGAIHRTLGSHLCLLTASNRPLRPCKNAFLTANLDGDENLCNFVTELRKYLNNGRQKAEESSDNRLRQLPERGRNDGRPSSYGGNEAVRGRERVAPLQARIAKRRKNPVCAP